MATKPTSHLPLAIRNASLATKLEHLARLSPERARAVDVLVTAALETSWEELGATPEREPIEKGNAPGREEPKKGGA